MQFCEKNELCPRFEPLKFKSASCGPALKKIPVNLSLIDRIMATMAYRHGRSTTLIQNLTALLYLVDNIDPKILAGVTLLYNGFRR